MGPETLSTGYLNPLGMLILTPTSQSTIRSNRCRVPKPFKIQTSDWTTGEKRTVPHHSSPGGVTVIKCRRKGLGWLGIRSFEGQQLVDPGTLTTSETYNIIEWRFVSEGQGHICLIPGRLPPSLLTLMLIAFLSKCLIILEYVARRKLHSPC